MRKLKLQMQMTLDGFVSTGPRDEQKWVTWAWDEIKHDVLDLANSCDTELIGRKLAVDYIPFWTETLSQPESMMYEAAKIKAGQKKIVFSKTLNKSIWENTEVAKGDLVEEIRKLKNQNGKDIIVYGGTSFVASLIKEGLIDELNLFLNPVAIGKGESIFSSLEEFRKLQLKKTITYDSGIVLLKYEAK
ncbi:MAG: dihydrofolate reductase family protein [Melioribacteraceae bacterium]|nr:dihydrofolate reductase family protein [Melioribacteraceae bacterium]MCF8353686.1 dihydrofolate reductase family protein [Melioribacteraceae bacterium]MCF8394468.1 dihydrofolate reductase family protein [Melioribacteraceae bacterium]MCF8418602.1 dihydrofolate reductase family protein [Melioribacteraceae bacterium]